MTDGKQQDHEHTLEWIAAGLVAGGNGFRGVTQGRAEIPSVQPVHNAQATTTIPTVMAYSTDPVGNGFVASLALVVCYAACPKIPLEHIDDRDIAHRCRNSGLQDL